MNRQKTAAKAQKPAGKAKKETYRPIPRRTKKGPEKPIKGGLKPAGAEECGKFLDKIRKANPLAAAFLGFMEEIGIKPAAIKVVTVKTEPAVKQSRSRAAKTRKAEKRNFRKTAQKPPFHEKKSHKTTQNT